jgi:adhesin transport system outer membrane protein
LYKRVVKIKNVNIKHGVFNMKNINKTIMSSFALAMTASTALADSMTLADVVERTLDTHPEYQQAQRLIDSAKEGVKQAKAGYLPKVDVALGTGYERVENQSTINKSVANSYKDGDADSNRQEASLTVTQMLFDGFATPARVAQSRANLENQMNFGKQVANKLVSLSSEAFYAVQKEQVNLVIDEENLRMHKEFQDQIQKRVRSGKSNKADLEQMNSRVALAESQLIARQELLEQARSEFFRQVGMEPESLETNVVDYSLVPATLEEAVDIALATNPRIKSLEAALKASDASITEAKAAYMPRFDLELEATRDQNVNGIDKKSHSEQAMVRMSYNLYNGGADKARHLATLSEKEAARQALEDVKRSVAKDVRVSWFEYQMTSKRMSALQAQVRAAKATKIAYKSQFDVGQRTLLDVLDSEREYNNARIVLETTKSDRDYSVYQLLSFMGTAAGMFEQEPEVILDTTEAVAVQAQEAAPAELAQPKEQIVEVETTETVQAPTPVSEDLLLDITEDEDEFANIDEMIENSDLFKDE